MRKIEIIILLIFMFGLFGCNGQKKDFVFEKFKTELGKSGLKIDSIDKEDFVHINIDGNDLKISLENVRRNYERDSDESHITDLVNLITSYWSRIPNWEISKNKVYIQLFPNDIEFKNFINEKVTDEFSKVYVVSENEKLSWISKEDIKGWKISESELTKQANINADKLLAETKINFEIIENRKLGVIEVERTSLKGSLLFAPKMKEKLNKDFGFPFYAVIPVRDFCYIFSEKDFEFFSNRIGEVVVEEYKNSGYPITTEILKFTENGIKSVGKYPVKK
ncbi:hypothetical protein [Flavobacterium sp. N3904]|uniref:hypothetical protein n=1 Tax=Flavobacterium sp. N3904 TaxID=2986835 RepID=UPI00222453F3|nr:hypothetical protein [Flavobacterium sp. N3904]